MASWRDRNRRRDPRLDATVVLIESLTEGSPYRVLEIDRLNPDRLLYLLMPLPDGDPRWYAPEDFTNTPSRSRYDLV